MNKKSARKKGCTLLSLLLVSLTAVFAAMGTLLSASGLSGSEVQAEDPDGIDASIFDLQRDASQANENILDYLKCVPKGRSSSATPYPDYYAGSFIDDDGKLVVMLTENSAKIKSDLEQVAGNNAVKFTTAKYSYEELTQMMNTISDKIDKNSQKKKAGILEDQTYNIFDDIGYFMLLDDQNAISVSVININDFKIAEFKKFVSDSDAIVFENTVGGIEDAGGSTNPGKKIGIDVGGGYASPLTAAFRVKRNTTAGEEKGFITCAHGTGNKIGATMLSLSGQLVVGTLGTVKLRQYSETHDLSYVKLASDSSASNIIYGTNYTLVGDNDHIAEPSLNKFVVKYGAKSGCTSGYIKSINFRGVANDDTVFTGLIAADYKCQKGDSGGLVCSDQNGYNFNAMGIIKGYTKDGKYSVFISAKKAVNLWYLNRY